MVLGETLDKSEQTSDWSAPTFPRRSSPMRSMTPSSRIAILEALRAELHAKSELHGVDIAAGYEDLRFSAAMARDMEHAGIGFDVAAHAAWMARKAEPVAARSTRISSSLEPALTPACIASDVQLDALVPGASRTYAPRDSGARCSAWPKTEKSTAPLLRSRGARHRFSPPIGCSPPSGS